MYETALSAGIFVVAFTIPPQTTGDLASYRQGVNTQIRDYVRSHPGMLLVDLADIWQDHSVGGFVANSAYFHDTTHPNARGAQVAGYAIAEALDQLLPTSVYAASSALAPDNMLTNGRFAGSGTSLASGWSVATGSATYAYVPGPNGVGQRLAVTVPVGGSVTLTQNVELGVLLRQGDEFDVSVTIEPYDLEAFGASTQRVNVYTQNYNGSSFSERKDAVYADGGAAYGNARFPAGRGRFQSQRGTLTSGKTLMQMAISLNGGGTYLVSDAVARNLTMLESGLAAPENVPHTNLITNGAFETNATGWSGGDSAVVARTTSEKHSGTAGLSITNTASVNSDGRFTTVTVDPLKLLNYVTWVKAPSGHLGKLNFNWFNGGSYTSVTSVLFTGTGNWQKIIGTISAATIPDTINGLLLAVARQDATGTPVVYIDDVDVWQP